MILKETIDKLLAQFAPLTLIKHVSPVDNVLEHTLSRTTHENQPWLNADEIELTADDFA